MLPLIQKLNIFLMQIYTTPHFLNPTILLKIYKIPLLQKRGVFLTPDNHRPAGGCKNPNFCQDLSTGDKTMAIRLPKVFD